MHSVVVIDSDRFELPSEAIMRALGKIIGYISWSKSWRWLQLMIVDMNS